MGRKLGVNLTILFCRSISVLFKNACDDWQALISNNMHQERSDVFDEVECNHGETGI